LSSSLENITDWAINLASQHSQNNRRGRHFRPQNNRPTPHSPTLASPLVVPNRDIPRINQALPSEPEFPSIRQTLVPPLLVREHSTSSKEARHQRLPENQAYNHLPEAIYVSDSLPTRKPQELQVFKQHCRLQFNQSQTTIVWNQPLECLREISSSPLNFQNLLWKNRITVTAYRIIEEYHWIRRQIRHNIPDRAILQPAFRVEYWWNESGWTVKCLPCHL
jgi:hypothetical protein